MPLDVRVTIGADKVTAAAAGFSVVLAGEFLPAKDAAKVEDAVRGAFAKTGDTPFELAALALENPDGLFVPVSLLNALRRDLYAEIKTEEKTTGSAADREVVCGGEKRWIIRTDDLDTLAAIDLNEVDEVTVLLSPEFDAERLKTLPKNKLRLRCRLWNAHRQSMPNRCGGCLKAVSGNGKSAIGGDWKCCRQTALISVSTAVFTC